MESSTAETRDHLGANVVHVAAAQSPYRVDSTTRLLPGSPDSPGHDDAPPSVAGRVPSSTTAATTANCSKDTVGCCPLPNSSVGLPAISPQRPDITALGHAETKSNADNRTASDNHDSTKPTTDASPSPAGGGDTVADDMVTFRAALDAVDPSSLVGLRRARSKSVLVPVYRPPPAAVSFRSRGSVQCDQVMHADDDDNVDDKTEHPKHHQRLYQQQQQTAKAIQTSVSYTRERFRSASLATQRSRRSRDSTSMSEMCLEYMRLNGIIPRYPSLQHHDDGLSRSSYIRCIYQCLSTVIIIPHLHDVALWLSGNALLFINEVTLRRARLVFGWATVCRRLNNLNVFPATQLNPSLPSVCR